MGVTRVVRRLSPPDALFLFTESQETMMHVGSLMPFSLPEGARPDFMRRLTEELRRKRDISAPFNLKLQTPDVLKNPFHAWVQAERIDIDYHVRRSALPSPGDERELGILVSRLHAISMDFHQPPWETHIIEGLERGRFALYTKVHHSLVDGFTAMRILARSLSKDPNDLDSPPFFALPELPREKAAADEADPSRLFTALRGQLSASGEVARLARDMLRGDASVRAGLVGPLEAPRSILNGRISRNRRFATQKYPLELIKALAKAGGGTLNDIVLALSAGALRKFLMRLNALPLEPLVAMIPVNVRPKDDPGGGNAVGSMLVSLATHIEEPASRLTAIMASTRAAKEQLQGMSRNAILQLSALMMLPSGLQHLTHTSGRLRPQFNVVISNVPGPDQPLYFRGARLEAVYPMSIPIHGQALNLTFQSYAGSLDVGLTGCRDTLPGLQRLALAMRESVFELGQALGVPVSL
jgi:diacylglycerol O-acyltransferase